MHTQGEWKVEVVKSGKDEVYARIMPHIGYVDAPKIGVYKKKLPAEALANAHLIAAAPEMYESLKSVKAGLELAQGEWVSVIDSRLPEWVLRFRECQNIVDAAIAKAEGRNV